MKYIFHFTLAPVQSFIAQARKTQDLYAGSQILSDLTKVAATEAKNKDILLVFPTNTEGGASFPNRFIGITKEGFNTGLQDKGQAIENEVIKTFKKYALDALKEIGLTEHTAPNGFWEQINTHLDINWLFHPIENEDYAKAYKEVEAIMASLKNVRLISNVHPEAGRKCSLDGERNVKFYRLAENENRDRILRTKLFLDKTKEDTVFIADKNKYPFSILPPGEGLSAVSLVKRTFDSKNFPSTAEIALMDVLNKAIQNEKTCENICAFISCFSPNGVTSFKCQGIDYSDFALWVKRCFNDSFNWQFFYEENISSISTIQKLANMPNLNVQLFQDIQSCYAKIRHLFKNKYYALIIFDGDRMGKIMSGAFLKEEYQSELQAFQSKTSELLSTYATYAKNEGLIEPHGKSVYAGGDDFLGFANLENLFTVMGGLRCKFDSMVNKELKKAFQDKLEDNFNFNFSAGIAIAHYKTPLSMVLEKARDMEKLAKQEDKGDRDACAIAAMKHSGENHAAYFKWDLENGLPKWNALKDLVNSFQNDCSETFVRSLDREFYNLQDGKGNIKNSEGILDFKDEKTKKKVEESIFMIQTELLRLATKSLNQDKKGKANDLKNTVWAFFKEDNKTTHTSVAAENGMEAVKTALFLKRQTKKEKDNGHQN